jgi:tetratricopeptide (TPR) repeat protein
MATQTIKCKYFPMLPARWHCGHCNVDMANQCAKEANPQNSDKKICPVCFSQLQSLGIANSIKPFWERIPKFFAYPAQRNTLLYLGALSLSMLVAIFMPLIGIFIILAASFAVIKFAYKCLNHAASGNLLPPETSIFKNDDDLHPHIVLKQFCIFVFISFVIGFSVGLGKLIAVLVTFFSLLSLPAIIMLLAMTGSFFEAVNPVKAIKIMTAMGKSYLILYIFLLLIYGSDELIEYWARNVISPFILFPSVFFINSYFSIVIFSMMGYALYQFHEKFGFDKVVEVNLEAEGIDIKASGINQDPFLNEIHILVTEGMVEEAINRLSKQLKSFNSPLIYHEKYHSLLKLVNDKDKIAQHTTEYMQLLLNQPKVNKGTIIGIYADCLKVVPDYFYPNAAVAVDLAKTAQELFKYNDALAILNNFAKNYPNSDQFPYAYFIVAQLFVDHKQQEAQAKKILQALLTKYPGHELTEKIQDYLKLIEKLNSQ